MRAAPGDGYRRDGRVDPVGAICRRYFITVGWGGVRRVAGWLTSRVVRDGRTIASLRSVSVSILIHRSAGRIRFAPTSSRLGRTRNPLSPWTLGGHQPHESPQHPSILPLERAAITGRSHTGRRRALGTLTVDPSCSKTAPADQRHRGRDDQTGVSLPARASVATSL